jgi:hypothetical protein
MTCVKVARSTESWNHMFAMISVIMTPPLASRNHAKWPLAEMQMEVIHRKHGQLSFLIPAHTSEQAEYLLKALKLPLSVSATQELVCEYSDILALLHTCCLEHACTQHAYFSMYVVRNMHI